MGMSASQARLLTITARLSDLELNAQVISNKKIRTSMKAQKVAEDYANALNNKKTVTEGGTTTTVTPNSLSAAALTGFAAGKAQIILKNKDGKIIVPESFPQATVNDADSRFKDFLAEVGYKDTDGADKKNYYLNIYTAMVSPQGYTTATAAQLNDPNWINAGLKDGSLYVEKSTSGGTPVKTTEFTPFTTTTGGTTKEVFDTSDDDAAEATYNAETAKLATEDKMYDLQLRNIDTEHTALQTEYDSVDKVLDKNIERTFKIFG